MVTVPRLKLVPGEPCIEFCLQNFQQFVDRKDGIIHLITGVNGRDFFVPDQQERIRRIQLLKMLQEMPGYRGYFYTYRPLIGVTSIKGPDGITTYFTYDSFGRLVESYIWENNVKKTITAFDYNFPTH